MAFDLTPGLEVDIPQLAQLWQSSFRSYDIWTAAMHDVSSEDELAFYNKALTRRMKLQNTFTTKITERETNKIVAWSTMSAPDTKKREEETEPKPTSILPEKIDMGIWAIQGKCFEVMKAFGYDANIDFFRSGLIVDPAYQKLGLGRRLAVFDCEITDEAGARTWVIASANSRKLFVSVGFVEVGCESVVLGEGEGGEEKVGRNWVTVREPTGKGRRLTDSEI